MFVLGVLFDNFLDVFDCFFVELIVCEDEEMGDVFKSSVD